MQLIQELLTLKEDVEGTPIPPRIVRLMRDEDLKYPGADTIEKLKQAHAKQLLARDGGEDSAERALSYALGMNGKSKDELKNIVHPPAHASSGDSGWKFEADNHGWEDTDTLTHTTPDGHDWVIDRVPSSPSTKGRYPDYYQVIHVTNDGDMVDHDQLDISDGMQAQHAIHSIEQHLKKNGIPVPTPEDFKKIGLEP